MKTFTFSSASNQLNGFPFSYLLIAFSLMACSKTVDLPSGQVSTGAKTEVTPVVITNFKSNGSTCHLIQANDNKNAITLNWEASTSNVKPVYTIEAAIAGTNFADYIELAQTEAAAVSLSVKQLNQDACKLIVAGTKASLEFRVRADNGKTVFSNPIALQVGTYQPYQPLALPYYMMVPGNYQNWDVTDAPKIADVNKNKEYEGFVNFTNPCSQFLLLKDSKWDAANTYQYIGNGKFGYNGSVFSVFGGAGVYQLKANANTNTWSYHKVKSFGIRGSAVEVNGLDPAMNYDAENMTWTLKMNLVKGSFRIRANNENTIQFGVKMVEGYRVPAADGADFEVAKSGLYTVVLNLKLSGNYSCSLIKMN